MVPILTLVVPMVLLPMPYYWYQYRLIGTNTLVRTANTSTSINTTTGTDTGTDTVVSELVGNTHRLERKDGLRWWCCCSTCC
jgi:hypothetical protein